MINLANKTVRNNENRQNLTRAACRSTRTVQTMALKLEKKKKTTAYACERLARVVKQKHVLSLFISGC